MYILGMFVGEQFPEGEERDDLDFFTFPALDEEIGSGALDAPIDGYMMTADPENEAAAKEFLTFLGSAEAGEIFVATNPNNIAAQLRRGHQRLQRPAAEGGRADRERGQHRAVPRPGHPARLRLDDRDPRPAEVSAGPGGHRLGPGRPAGRQGASVRRGQLSPVSQTPIAAPPAPAGGAGPRRPRRKRLQLLTKADRVVLAVMVAVPAVLVLCIVWLPALSTVVLSFTGWNGIGGLDRINFIGATNYENITTNYPPFWTAVRNNVLWLVVFFLVATPLGMFLAVLLDRDLKGSWFYRSSIYLPVVLSLALAGFIWQLHVQP